jgi:SAM-dependent methyltransferase
VLIPLARHAHRTVGVDVSVAMLDEARRNCDALSAPKVELVRPDAMSRIGRFDLVHSMLVLQHLPVPQGERVLGELVDVLRPGGVGVIQVLIGGPRSLLVLNELLKAPLAHNILNLLNRRPWRYPNMQMNVYDINRLLAIIRTRGVSFVHVNLREPADGYQDCWLIFRR